MRLVQQQQSKQSGGGAGSVQLVASSSASPEQIDDGDEADRVCQMLQRDSLVRGMGVVELVHRLLKSVHDNDPASAVLPATNSRQLPPNNVCYIPFIYLFIRFDPIKTQEEGHPACEKLGVGLLVAIN